MNQVVIIHGWSDTSKSFESLAGFLKANGYHAIKLWLGDYISMEDDVSVPDVAKRLQQVVAAKQASGDLAPQFDLIVHSTGGLVARQWLSTYHAYPDTPAPVKRLIMLAPANHGSKLAKLGKSMLGRIFKGAKHWFHTGTSMLNNLELASPYQWDLAQRDVFNRSGNEPAVYAPDRVWPFVIVGTYPYSGLREIVNEDGSDGTVRVPAANLNARGVTITFSGEGVPAFDPWPLRNPDWRHPMLVLPNHTHGSITDPAAKKQAVPLKDDVSDPLAAAVLRALGCQTAAEYATIASDWYDDSERVVSLCDANKRELYFQKPKDADEGYFHQYFQVVVRVMDDHGQDIEDYFLEFGGPDSSKKSRSMSYFHSEVLEKVTCNSQNPALRCLYLDRTDLMLNFYGTYADQVAMNLAISPSDNISYFDNSRNIGQGSVPIHRENEAHRWLKRNTTHYVEIIVPRIPANRVFKIRQG